MDSDTRFLPLFFFFSSNNFPWAPDTRAKAFLNMASIRGENWQSCLHIGVKEKAVHITAVSMTPLCMSQQCQWLHCACHSGVNNTAVYITAVSLTPLGNQLCRIFSQWSKTLLLGQKSDSAAHSTDVSLIPLWHAQQYHWHCCDIHNGVNDTAVTCSAVSIIPMYMSRGVIDTALTKVGNFIVDNLREFEDIFKKA
jgi:hypothetical protein